MSFRLQNYYLLPDITLQTSLTSLPLNESKHYIVFKCLFPTFTECEGTASQGRFVLHSQQLLKTDMCSVIPDIKSG